MKFRNFIGRMMAGRLGTDRLNRFLSLFTVVMLLVSMLLSRRGIGSLAWALGIVSLALMLLRSFSRNLEKRYRENQAYERISGKLTGTIRGYRSRFRQRKEYRFFRCPSCRTWLRVPRGKGKVNITCRHCGQRFTKNT